MEFLKEILGEELYKQITEKLNAHNGNEANKDNQIKLGNLGSGDYVGKAKYDALQELLTGKENELTTANGLIAELKKGTKGNEELQGKISQYETTVSELQAQLAQERVESALKIALLSEKATDVPYLTFKVNEKLRAEGKNIELDDNGSIKGWDTLLSGLKTQFPNQFETGSGRKKIDENKLPEDRGGDSSPTSLEEALRMEYGKNDL